MATDRTHDLLEAAFREEIDYLGGTNPIYIGYAPTGSLTSQEKWQIRRYTYDASNNPLRREFPNDAKGPNSDHKFIWDNRAGYTYG